MADKTCRLIHPPNAIILQPPLRLIAMVMGDDQGKGWLTAMVMGDDQGKGWHTKKAPSFSFYHNGPERAIRIKYILLRIFGPKPHEKTEKMAPGFI